MLLLASSSYGCSNKPEPLKNIAEEIQEQIEKQNSEETTEQNKEKVFKLLSKGISVKELQKVIKLLSNDNKQEYSASNLTPEQLQLKREGVECVTCNSKSIDPNMRSKN
jgi:response regulator of citrate/malate metabolism